MRIKAIFIYFEHEPGDSPNVPDPANHAQVFKFEQGKWTADGPVFSRFLSSAHEIWKIARDGMRGEI